jgi:4a-hydroxytetrahydrobiopterin dehydratase
MAKPLLDDGELDALKTGLPDWTLADDRKAISRRFTFEDFVAAFSFMSACALIAEKMDHHPEWSNVYKTVDVRLTTHDSGGITALDIRLAQRMDRLSA